MAVTSIVLDAGHGGFDNGATYEDRIEKDDALELTMAVGKQLEDNGYDIYYTRTTDVYDSPYQKADKANATGADYFISFHRNSSPTPNTYNGVQSLIYPGSVIPEKIGNSVNSELEKVGFQNLGIVDRPNLVVLNRTEMPAVLLEVGFINSDKDNQIFEEQFDDVVTAIVKGIQQEIPVNNSKPQKSYAVQVGLFTNYSNAEFLRNQLEEMGYSVAIRFDEPYYTVIVGNEPTLEDATELQERLRSAGYETMIVTN